MLKTAISILLMTFFPVAAFAQSDEIRELNARVAALTAQDNPDISSEDQRIIRLRLREILFIFAEYGIVYDQSASARVEAEAIPRQLLCDSQNNRLIDLANGNAVVYAFKNINNCREARDLVRQNLHFCDYSDNTLRTPQARLVHDFSDSDSCGIAIRRASAGRNFCDFEDNTMRNSQGALLIDLGSERDCRAALAASN